MPNGISGMVHVAVVDGAVIIDREAGEQVTVDDRSQIVYDGGARHYEFSLELGTFTTTDDMKNAFNVDRDGNATVVKAEAISSAKQVVFHAGRRGGQGSPCLLDGVG